MTLDKSFYFKTKWKAGEDDIEDDHTYFARRTLDGFTIVMHKDKYEHGVELSLNVVVAYVESGEWEIVKVEEE